MPYLIPDSIPNRGCFRTVFCTLFTEKELIRTVFWHLVHYSVLYSSCHILYIILMCGFVHYSEPYSRTIFCTVFYARGCVICFIPYSGLILQKCRKCTIFRTLFFVKCVIPASILSGIVVILFQVLKLCAHLICEAVLVALED